MTAGQARFGAVAAGHRITADAAMEILQDGGNAFDAIIAALWTACVAEPVLASPGGGGFLMAYRDGRTELVDFFVDAPKAKRPPNDVEFEQVFADFGATKQGFHIGRGASAVPGYVPGLFQISEVYGTLPMARLVEPAVRVARAGLAMTPFQAFLCSVVQPILAWTPEARELFAPDGNTLGAGEVLKNPDLANILEDTGRNKLDWWTHGDMANAMLAGQRESGYLGPDDLAGYQVETRVPLRMEVGSHSVFLNPPPSLGGAIIAAMNALAGPAVDALARAMDSVDRLWRQAPEDAGRLIRMVGAPSSGGVASRGTTHVSVLDTKGNAAAATVSNGEGNGYLVPGGGFMVNNMLGEEDVNPRGFHNWLPGQRLGSMMAPTLAIGPGSDKAEGSILVLGSGGSNRIRTAVLQVLIRRLRQGLALNDAIEHPRLHVERAHLDVEPGLSETEMSLLQSAFPDLRQWPGHNLYFGGVHGVERDADGRVSGAGDSRREGAFVWA